MHYIVHYIAGQMAAFGAGVVELAIACGSFAAAGAAGYYAFHFARKSWVGWSVGILAFLLMLVIFGPIYEAAKRIDCRHSDDYQACMDGEQGDD
jgi:hypothetical protein